MRPRLGRLHRGHAAAAAASRISTACVCCSRSDLARQHCATVPLILARRQQPGTTVPLRAPRPTLRWSSLSSQSLAALRWFQVCRFLNTFFFLILI